jgi:aerotaxis receptor
MRWLRRSKTTSALTTVGQGDSDVRWHERLAEACDQIEGDLEVTLRRLVVQAETARGEAVETRVAIEAMGDSAAAAVTRAASTGDGTAAVAAAVEELAASGLEIARQASRSRDVGVAAATAAASTRAQMRELESAAQEISGVVALIEDIANRTNLLALNATIEAARAGAAGRGFAVVAEEVKSLSNQTREATVTIGARIAAMREVVGTTLHSVEAIDGVMIEIGEAASATAAAVEEQGAANRSIAESAQHTAGEARAMALEMQRIKDETASVMAVADQMAERVGGTGQALVDLRRRLAVSLRQSVLADRRQSDRLPATLRITLENDRGSHVAETIDLSEGGVLVAADGLPALSLDTGVTLQLPGIGRLAACLRRASEVGLHFAFADLGDAERAALQQVLASIKAAETRFVERATAIGRHIEATFSEGIASGRVSEADLFDTDYQPVPGSDPEQVTSRAIGFLEACLPALIEPALAEDDAIVFCAPVDRNGWLPVHNRVFSQPQRPGDRAWNTAHARNRRIFDDRAGLAAARNQRAFLIQAYQRDMGGGHKLMMKEVDVPITVADRHWGGLRLAYRL